MGPVDCPEMSELCNNPEEQRCRVHHGDSLTFPVKNVIYQCNILNAGQIDQSHIYPAIYFVRLLSRLYENIFYTIIYVQLRTKVDNVHQ